MSNPLKKIPHVTNWQAFGIGFGLFCLLFREIAPATFIESFYSRGLYLLISKAFSITAALPFSFSYISIPVLLILIAYPFVKIWRRNDLPVKKSILSVWHLFASLGWLIGGFFLLWGFNYGRISTEEQLGLKEVKISLEKVKAYVKGDVKELLTLRGQIDSVSNLTPEQTAALRKSLQSVLQSLNYPAEQTVICHPLYPKGSLLRWSTSGIYIPYSGQGHIDPGLHPLQEPFVLAHEMAHGYGFTGEGICNFWAYLACKNADDPFIQYSGSLGLWRYMASSWRFFEEDTYMEFRQSLPEEILEDINAINQTITAYPDILPEVRDYVYDSFLKSQGLEDGIQNYDKIIPLAIQWRERDGIHEYMNK